jgi:hypothetical protein
VTLDGTNAVIAGTLSGDADFGGGKMITGCPNAGCVILAAYAQGDGAPQWAKQAASTPMRTTGAANPREQWLATSGTDLVLAVGGYFESGFQTDANQLVLNKYDAMGNLTWAKAAMQDMGMGPDVGGLGVDASGNIYVGGAFGSTLKFGTQPAIDSHGGYVAKFDSSGNVAWASSSPGTPNAYNVTALAVSGKLYTFGNGSNDNTGLPEDAVSMAAVPYDLSTGTQGTPVFCGTNGSGRGDSVSASAGGVFVAGEGGQPGTFGKATTSNDGLFIAKLK